MQLNAASLFPTFIYNWLRCYFYSHWFWSTQREHTDYFGFLKPAEENSFSLFWQSCCGYTFFVSIIKISNYSSLNFRNQPLWQQSNLFLTESSITAEWNISWQLCSLIDQYSRTIWVALVCSPSPLIFVLKWCNS